MKKKSILQPAFIIRTH